MKITDLHIHSNWSSDSNLPMQVAVDTAIGGHISCMAFTDHLDIGYPTSSSPFLNIPSYLYQISALQKDANITILKGIEVGITKSNRKETQSILEYFSFDYIIASCHGNDEVEFFSKKARELYGDNLLKVYFNHILFIVLSLSSFHSLAHIDYILRYHPLSLEEFLDYESDIDKILQVLIQRNKALEINTKDMTSEKCKSMYSFLLTRYRKLGGKWVVFGSDAHQAKDIGKSYQDAKGILNQAGFSSFAIPTQHGWVLSSESSL
ncbi:MAG: histidinol-phosphatase HisJ family protein [Caldisericia bacterium]|nr:histidinol-phosphatase HisJ family protein [Caldisericia bacterium]MDD4614981.1 histidinol-phosphatase HisJ family protein [Caldisericia bacterium]